MTGSKSVWGVSLSYLDKCLWFYIWPLLRRPGMGGWEDISVSITVIRYQTVSPEGSVCLQ